MSQSHRYISQGAGLPNWENPISHAVVANNMCFVSGQLSVNEAGQYVPGTIEQEARLAFANFMAAVNAADFRAQDIVFVDVALTNIDDIPVINALYCELFPAERRPARTLYQVVDLPFGGKVKVMGTAVKASS